MFLQDNYPTRTKRREQSYCLYELVLKHAPMKFRCRKVEIRFCRVTYIEKLFQRVTLTEMKYMGSP